VSDLSQGWAWSRLKDCAENLDSMRIPINRSERSGRQGKIPYYGATGQVGWIDHPLFDEELVLLGEDGAPFLERHRPKAYLINGPSWVNNHAHVLRGGAVSNRYLVHFLNSIDYHGLANGTTRLKLTQASMNSIAVPVAPEPEQQRIVATIDEQYSRVDAGVAALERALHNLKRMRAAVLHAAVTGRLASSYGTGSDHKGGPSGWCVVSVGDIAEVSGGITKNPKRRPHKNPVPFLRVANVLRDGLALDDVHEIEVFDGELERKRLRAGDLLVVEGNGSPDQIGRSALWHGEIDPCVHQNHLIRVRPNERVLPEYLNLYWNAPSSMATIQSAASSTSGLHSLSTGKVRSIPVALPPVDTQKRIVEEVRRQLSLVDALVDAVHATMSRSHSLRSSILTEAFAGRLAPQEPTDEAASVLLGRIANQRLAMTGNRPGMRTRRTTVPV
jgi:type I restriction enzyme, S subunit